MKKIFHFLVSFTIIVSLSIASCKKDCSPDPPPDSIPDTNHNCSPTYYYLTDTTKTFFDFYLNKTYYYFNQNNELFKFNTYGKRDTLEGDCSSRYQNVTTNYYCSENNINIEYSLFPTINFANNFTIYFNPSQSCYSTLYFDTDTMPEPIHSYTVLGKTFYDVYSDSIYWNCFAEIYYNKEYGIVSFRRFNELFVLETDSL